MAHLKSLRANDMSYHNIDQVNPDHLSESEEMYLNTVARLGEEGIAEPVSLSALADALGLSPVSVNQMVRKLAESDHVEYLPYHGVKLTSTGRRIALRVLRARRLWQVFLVQHLQLPADKADALACRMEHITPDEIVSRLDQFLGHPETNPWGKPIPGLDADEPLRSSVGLDRLLIGQVGEIVSVAGDTSVRGFLAGEGLVIGAVVRVRAVGHNGALLLDVAGRSVQVDATAARDVQICHMPERRPFADRMVELHSRESQLSGEMQPGTPDLLPSTQA